MASVIRLSRFGKIAAFTTATGGSLYLFRDHLKPYISASRNEVRDENKHTNVIKQKAPIENLPEQIPYLLVGGGTASHSAMRAIRGYDPKAKVLIIGTENKPPYMRPMLSKDLWFTEPEMRKNLRFGWVKDKDRSIYYECDEFYLPLEMMQNRETGGVSLIKDTRLTRLDPDNKLAHLETGQQIKYEKCLLATGGTPKKLGVLESAPDDVKEKILYFRTAEDFLKLEEISEKAGTIVIIGGGFLGSELTCALAYGGPDEESAKRRETQTIYQIFPETGALGKILPEHLSEFVSSKIEAEGVKLVAGVQVEQAAMSQDKKSVELRLSNGQTINADHIVCAVGLEPDVQLAKSSGLEIDDKTGGYLVNSELEARSDVWVAGDASCFYDRKLGRRRVEHHDHAINSGKLAGENMTGAGKAYTHQSMFWSEIGRDISFEAVGIIDSSLETVSVFADPVELASLEMEAANTLADETANKKQESSSAADDTSSRSGNSEVNLGHQNKATEPLDEVINPKEVDKYAKGVVFYLRDGYIVGILLWNLFSRLTIARRLLNEQKKYDDLNDVAKMFNLYLDDMKTV